MQIWFLINVTPPGLLVELCPRILPLDLYEQRKCCKTYCQEVTMGFVRWIQIKQVVKSKVSTKFRTQGIWHTVPVM